MKLIVKRYIDGDIIYVENITRYTQREKNPISEERLQEIVSSQNEVNDSIQYKIVEIPEDDSSVCEIIRMLLGEKQYKRSYEFEDLYESINEFKEQTPELISFLTRTQLINDIQINNQDIYTYLFKQVFEDKMSYRDVIPNNDAKLNSTNVIMLSNSLHMLVSKMSLDDKIKNEKLESNDIKAIIIAMMQVALPLALGIAFIYYLILLFLTKVWL